MAQQLLALLIQLQAEHKMLIKNVNLNFNSQQLLHQILILLNCLIDFLILVDFKILIFNKFLLLIIKKKLIFEYFNCSFSLSIYIFL